MDVATDVKHGHGELRYRRPTADTLLVELSGHWQLGDEFPSLTEVEQHLEASPRVQRMTASPKNWRNFLR